MITLKGAAFVLTNLIVSRVLLRVRLLYYIKQEIIGEEAKKVFQGYPST